MDMDCLRSKFYDSGLVCVSRAPGYFIGIYRSDFSFGRRAGVVPDAFAMPEGCAEQAAQVVCLHSKIEWPKIASRGNQAARQNVVGVRGKNCRGRDPVYFL